MAEFLCPVKPTRRTLPSLFRDRYGRMQGVVFRPGDTRFEGKPADEAVRAVAASPGVVMVNRNRGSGTRVLIDHLLGGARPAARGTSSRPLASKLRLTRRGGYGNWWSCRSRRRRAPMRGDQRELASRPPRRVAGIDLPGIRSWVYQMKGIDPSRRCYRRPSVE